MVDINLFSIDGLDTDMDASDAIALWRQTGITLIELQLRKYLDEFLHHHRFDLKDVGLAHIAEYPVSEPGQRGSGIVCSAEADDIITQIHASIDPDARQQFEQTIKSLETMPAQQWNVWRTWLRTSLTKRNDANLLHYIPEAAACIIADDRLSRQVREVKRHAEVDGLFGQHPRIARGRMPVALDEFLKRNPTSMSSCRGTDATSI